jgi:hypothetical protein
VMTIISRHVWDHLWGDVLNSITLKNEKHIRGLLEKYPTVFFLCEHLMDYNLACLHEPTLNLSAHA